MEGALSAKNDWSVNVTMLMPNNHQCSSKEYKLREEGMETWKDNEENYAFNLRFPFYLVGGIKTFGKLCSSINSLFDQSRN